MKCIIATTAMSMLMPIFLLYSWMCVYCHNCNVDTHANISALPWGLYWGQLCVHMYCTLDCTVVSWSNRAGQCKQSVQCPLQKVSIKPGAHILHNSRIIIGEKFPYFQNLGKSLPIFSDVIKFSSLRWGRKLVLGEILKAWWSILERVLLTTFLKQGQN